MAVSEGDKTTSVLKETLTRGILAFLLHLLLGAAVIGLIFWLASGFDNASEQIRTSSADADDVQLAVLAQLADSRFALVQWAVVSMVVSWIMSTIFLFAAQRHEPRGDEEASRRFGVWGVLLVLTLGLTGLLWWRWVSIPQIAIALLASNYATIVAVAFAVTLLAYYLSTALIVKNALKASVPGARALPSLRR